MPHIELSNPDVERQPLPSALIPHSIRGDLSPSVTFANGTEKQIAADSVHRISSSPSLAERDNGPLSDLRPGENRNPSARRSSDALQQARSSSASDDKSQQITTRDRGKHAGVYWYSKAYMLCSFVAGLAMAVGHHGYYSSLSGRRVGSIDDQQWALRSVFIFMESSHFRILDKLLHSLLSDAS